MTIVLKINNISKSTITKRGMNLQYSMITKLSFYWQIFNLEMMMRKFKKSLSLKLSMIIITEYKKEIKLNSLS